MCVCRAHTLSLLHTQLSLLHTPYYFTTTTLPSFLPAHTHTHRLPRPHENPASDFMGMWMEGLGSWNGSLIEQAHESWHPHYTLYHSAFLQRWGPLFHMTPAADLKFMKVCVCWAQGVGCVFVKGTRCWLDVGAGRRGSYRSGYSLVLTHGSKAKNVLSGGLRAWGLAHTPLVLLTCAAVCCLPRVCTVYPTACCATAHRR